jgi:G3E family GTPase
MASHPDRPTRAAVERIPVSLLTGFLGAGKTTLLNRWVRQPEMAGVAVLVNEFGEVGVDHHLVDGIDERMVLLDSGCLCCAVQGDLVGALKALALRSSKREIAPVTRVVIETSGLADPVPVIYTLMEDRFVAARYVCDGLLTVISATHGLGQLRGHAEAVRQVVAADRILISKCDQASTTELAALETQLLALNPGAALQRVRHGDADVAALLSCGLYTPSGKPLDLQEWLGEEAAGLAEPARPGRWLAGAVEPQAEQETIDAPAQGAYLRDGWRQRNRQTNKRHTPGVGSFVLDFERPLPWFGFAVAMGRLLREHGARLLRVKGLIAVNGDARPMVVQCVQGAAYPPVRLAAWPKDGPFRDGCGRLVFIVRGLEAEAASIRAALSSLLADAPALRAGAGDVGLPTRCWLSQRMPVLGSQPLQHGGWLVQPKRLHEVGAQPGPL